MPSYRHALEQIGIHATTRVSYSNFYSKPANLGRAIDAMQLAGEFDQISDIFLDEVWTDEVQGCGTDGTHWFFTSNNPRRLYVFNAGSPLHDSNIIGSFNFDSVEIPGGIDHIGQFDLFDGCIYVSHFNSAGAQVLILRNDGGALSYMSQLPVIMPTSQVTGRRDVAQFQCVVPWDRTFLSCFGSGTIDSLFIHDLTTGSWTGRSIRLRKPIHDWVQGIAFSPYGHLFIATSPGELPFPMFVDPESIDLGANQFIRVVSPLNGAELGRIPVLAEGSGQEMEGCYFAPARFSDGRTAELHVVLLANILIARDNIFFKSFHRTPLARVSTP
jgi:hypothetical protein